MFTNGDKSNKPGKKKNTRKYIKPRSIELATYHRSFKYSRTATGTTNR